MPRHYLQPERRKSCSSIVVLLGPITNPGSRATLGVLLARNRDGDSTCDPAPAPWPINCPHKSSRISWESSCASKSFLHQFLMRVLWARFPPQTREVRSALRVSNGKDDPLQGSRSESFPAPVDLQAFSCTSAFHISSQVSEIWKPYITPKEWPSSLLSFYLFNKYGI